ncbi:hypothetical protein Plhal703r1_c11g0060281 [Plasmopara halstedii]
MIAIQLFTLSNLLFYLTFPAGISQPPTAESHVPKALQYTKDTVISEHFTLSLWHSRLPASDLTGSPIFTPFSQE